MCNEIERTIQLLKNSTYLIVLFRFARHMYKASLKTVFLINILTHCVAEALAITPCAYQLMFFIVGIWKGASTAGLEIGASVTSGNSTKAGIQEFNTQNTPNNYLISIKTFARKFYESFFFLDLDTFDFK